MNPRIYCALLVVAVLCSSTYPGVEGKKVIFYKGVDMIKTSYILSGPERMPPCPISGQKRDHNNRCRSIKRVRARRRV